jgi:hypothetical protein
VSEAHRLLRQPPPGTGGGSAAHAVEMFAGLLAEIRAYGEAYPSRGQSHGPGEFDVCA